MPKIRIFKSGGSVSSEKAKEILRDGSVHGKKLTKKQRGFFGAQAGKAEDGTSIEPISANPYSAPVMEFQGPSHSEGGIDTLLNGQPVNVEGQETAYTAQDGSVNVWGNLTVPGTKMKFKTAGKKIAEAENKANKQMDQGISLINSSDPYNRFERLSFNTGLAKSLGAQTKQKDLTALKEQLTQTQDQILAASEFLGIDPEKLQAKKGIKISQEGGKYPWLSGVLNRPDYQSPISNEPVPVRAGRVSLAQRNNNPGNLKFAKWMSKYGAVPAEAGTDGGNFAKFPSLEQGQRAMVALLKDPSYQKRNVQDAITRWTGGSPYKIIPEALKNRKVSSLNPNEFTTLLNTITQGEDSKLYNWDVPNTPNQPGITLPEVEITGRRTPPTITPNINFGPDPSIDPGAPQTPPVELIEPSVPETVTPLTPATPREPFRNPLRFGQIAPEVLTLATERADFVPGQRYEPQLFQPYQVSFQDRLNENQSTFNALSRQMGRNAASLSSLAAQKYQADAQVLADEFRTNQGITNDVTNKNIALLNQAQLTNLQLNDQQFVRQEQARVNTRQNIRNAVQSISDKIQANRSENMNYAANQSVLFPNQAVDTKTGAIVFNGNDGLQFGGATGKPTNVNPYQTSRTTYDSSGTPRQTVVSTPSLVQQEQMNLNKFFTEQKKRRSLYDPKLFTK